MLIQGETFYFPDMFGLEATDLAEGSHDFMAETLFQFLDAKQLDSTKLENDHNLSRYRENSEMENLVSKRKNDDLTLFTAISYSMKKQL